MSKYNVLNYFLDHLGDVLRALGQNPTEAEIHKCCENWVDQGIHYILFMLFYLKYQYSLFYRDSNFFRRICSNIPSSQQKL